MGILYDGANKDEVMRFCNLVVDLGPLHILVLKIGESHIEIKRDHWLTVKTDFSGDFPAQLWEVWDDESFRSEYDAG